MEDLEPARMAEFGGGPDFGIKPPVYERGWAYLRGRRGAEAASEFQKILAHPTISGLSVAHPLSHLGLARAYVLQNDGPKARAALSGLPRDVERRHSDVLVLQQAKAEYAKLK